MGCNVCFTKNKGTMVQFNSEIIFTCTKFVFISSDVEWLQMSQPLQLNKLKLYITEKNRSTVLINWLSCIRFSFLVYVT